MNKHTLKYMKDHCKKRCLERYNITLSNGMLKSITDKIINGDCSPGVRGSEVYFVSLNSIRFRVAFDRSCNRLITFLPNEQTHKHNN
jgi:hypothetical protein